VNRTLQNLLKFLFFLAIGLGILYLVYWKLDVAYQEQCAIDGTPKEDCILINKVIADFASANYWWILLVLLAFIVSNVSRAIRWNMLLRQLGSRPRYSNAFLTVMLGYFANLGLPRMGEVIRAGSMARYERIPAEKVMGTVVADRVIDMLSLLIVVALAMVVEFDTLYGALRNLIYGSENQSNTTPIWQQSWFLILAASGILGMAFLWIIRKRLMQLALFQKVLKLVFGFWEGIKTVQKLKRPGWFIFHSLNIWFMYYLMTYLCFLSFAPTAQLGPMVALLVFVFGAFGFVIPSPGGMGTFHFLVIQALALYGVSQVDAFSYANISFFSIQLGCNVFFGIVALLLLPYLNKNYNPENEAAY
jgi:uncharacterized protein (TIRG00374 family)